ncbi:MAG: element excision factor XisH family protein [Nostoc sp. ChiSLP02]|nr:element excision factor XisH family protein [Nostoc sp. DedSLP05]MDZ8102441.1 element excision factor XisH family protein [Nostoc sp. DedSLP01]MDZ8189426.1 element excision factor XisH family protein [Nostoc sp. ChiSLP02]
MKLAVCISIYETFFQRKFIASTVEKYQLRLMFYDVQEETIRQWL